MGTKKAILGIFVKKRFVICHSGDFQQWKEASDPSPREAMRQPAGAIDFE